MSDTYSYEELNAMLVAIAEKLGHCSHSEESQLLSDLQYFETELERMPLSQLEQELEAV